MLRLDGMMMLVPATWTVPRAGPINTSRNKDFAEGRLTPVKADVAELISAGVKVPNPLFEAGGGNGVGGSVGAIAGVFDIGSEDPLTLVRQSVSQLSPAASIDETTIMAERAVRTLQRWEDEPVEGGSVICDYWGVLRHAPTSVSFIRFWRTGPAIPDEEGFMDDMAGSVMFSDPLSWSGPGRLVMKRFESPGSEVAVPGRLRYVGWRLGTVFHSKMLNAKTAAQATEMSMKRRDGLLFLAVFFSWLAATFTVVGFHQPSLMLGGITVVSQFRLVRNQGIKVVVRLAVILAALLAFGVATS